MIINPSRIVFKTVKCLGCGYENSLCFLREHGKDITTEHFRCRGCYKYISVDIEQTWHPTVPGNKIESKP